MTEPNVDRNEIKSCNPELSRKDFLKKVLGPSVVAGVLLAPPKVIDKFLIPGLPASASNARGFFKTSGAGTTPSIRTPY